MGRGRQEAGVTPSPQPGRLNQPVACCAVAWPALVIVNGLFGNSRRQAADRLLRTDSATF